MKNKYISLAQTVFFLLVLPSCNSGPVFTKLQYLSKFEEFITTTESNYMKFDNEAWKKANEKFKELSETDYSRFEKEMTADEKLKIDKLIGSYYSFVAKYQAAQVKEKLKRIYNQAEGFIDNLSK